MERDCKICEEKTENLFSLEYGETPVCEACANAIFLQQAPKEIKNSRN